MDPITIFQVVGAAVSLGDVVVKCITGLSSLKTKYHDAPLHISTLIGQLYIVRTALDQLSVWNKAENNRHNQLRYRELGLQMGNSLESFSVLILALQNQLDQFDSPTSSNTGAKDRMKFLWNEKEMTEYSTLLDRQVNALNLLLQVIQCQTRAQQQLMMDRQESQSVLRLAKDCSSSIFGLDDTHSFISETTADISVMFDFDNLILDSRIYQQAQRFHLREAIRARNGYRSSHPLEPIADDDGNTITVSRDKAASRIAGRRTEGQSNDNEADEVMRPENIRLQSPTTQIPHREPIRIQTKQTATTLATIDTIKPAQLLESIQQPRTFRLSSWFRKPLMPRKDIPDSIQSQNSPVPRILILGSSESGKSTLLFALRLSLQEQIPLDQRLGYREIIWSNVITGARTVLEAMESLGIPLQDTRNEYHAKTIFLQPTQGDKPLEPEFSHAIKTLWRDEGFQEAYKRRREYQLYDSFRNYSNDIERLISPDYEPTSEDMLRSRVKSTGILETGFAYKGLTYNISDVGGTRRERKKWIHAFENTTVVVFTIDACNYAGALYEDETANRMLEQIFLFETIVNSRWFSSSGFILVFTKIDKLEEELQTNPVEEHLPEYTQDLSLEPVESYMRYLEKRFLALIKSDVVLRNTRVIRSNLVDGSHQAGLDVWEILGQLAYPKGD